MLHLIINPTAGKGYPLTLLSQLRAELEKRGVEYAIRETEYPGHATELARQAAATGADVAACGGDGTLCEALCGLMGSQSTLYVVPCGTGNDFIKAFYGLSRDPIRALCQQLDGQVVRVDCGSTSFLFTGDAEWNAEHALLANGEPLQATVLKVGHHGSETSTCYAFLREIMPQYAVISVGKGNNYGHPAESTLSRLRDADVVVFRTDEQGTIICRSDGRNVTFETEK